MASMSREDTIQRLQELGVLNPADRNGHIDVGPANLQGADLRGADLREADLRQAHLGKARLEEANLQGALLPQSLWGVELTEANLREANLAGATIRSRSLKRVDLRGADLREAKLCRSFMSGTDLSQAQLQGIDLSGCTLYRAILMGADLTQANLQKADLGRALLNGANLSGADLSQAALDGADLSGAILDEDTRLTRASMTGTYLRGTYLGPLHLRETDFTQSLFYRKKDWDRNRIKTPFKDPRTGLEIPSSLLAQTVPQLWGIMCFGLGIGGAVFGCGSLRYGLELGVVLALPLGLMAGVVYEFCTPGRRVQEDDPRVDKALGGVSFGAILGVFFGLSFGWWCGLLGVGLGLGLGLLFGLGVKRVMVKLHHAIARAQHFRQHPHLRRQRPEGPDNAPQPAGHERTSRGIEAYNRGVVLIGFGVSTLIFFGWGIKDHFLAIILSLAVLPVGVPLFVGLGLLYQRYHYTQIVSRLRKANPDRPMNTSWTLRDCAPLLPYQVRTGEFTEFMGSGQGDRPLQGRDPATEIPILLAQFELAMWGERYKQASFQPRKSWPGWFWAPLFSGAVLWEPPGKFFPAVQLLVEKSRGGPCKSLYPLAPHRYADGQPYISLAIAEPYSSDDSDQVEWIFLWLQVQRAGDRLNWQFEVTRLNPYRGWCGVSVEHNKAAHGLFRTALSEWNTVLTDWDKPPSPPDPTSGVVRGRKSAD